MGSEGDVVKNWRNFNKKFFHSLQIVVVVKGKGTPCTLEKRYEADSSSPLPNTFVDGTDRPGSDATVTLETVQHGPHRETAEIYLKYVATKLIVRRVGRYLAFSAKMPEEILGTSQTYDEKGVELCTTGCPASELLDIQIARDFVVSRDQALRECSNLSNLSNDIQNTLTDSYLDWCVFDVMTAGAAYDFVAVAHSAQADALSIDPSSLRNRTNPLNFKERSSGGDSGCSSRVFQVPAYLLVLILIISRYLL